MRLLRGRLIPLRVMQDEWAALVAAVASETVVMPLDTVKIALQMERNAPRAGSGGGGRAMARRLFHERGVRGFYGGWIPAVARQTCFTVLRLGMYPSLTRTEARLSERVGVAAVIGVVSNSVALPFDVIKRRTQTAQLQSGREVLGGDFSQRLAAEPTLRPMQIARQLYQQEGWRGFYRGFMPTTGRAVTISAVQLPVYFGTQKVLQSSTWGRQHPVIATSIAAGFTTVCVTTAVAPVDLATTRYMTWRRQLLTSRSVSSWICAEWGEGGWRAIYRGYPVALTKAFPQFWLIATIYEALRR